MSRVLKHKKGKFSAGMVLIAVGIVYGDIATSPMYVMKSIIAGNGGIMNIDRDFIIGALSLVIWTITLLTTVKHVLIAMKADNHGEGGIFALYSLVKKFAKWLIIPAMVGGAALLADSVLTPAVTVTTAIEGLRSISFMDELLGTGQAPIIIIVLVILSILFIMQRAGTSIIGRTFGPFMAFWFTILAVSGIIHICSDVEILKAINPIYAIQVLFSPYNKVGIMILGSVFLATTGAEALYSDMGHVGKRSIYISWPFVKIALILNYLGQGAWIIANAGNPDIAGIEDLNPFYLMQFQELRIAGIIFGAMAAVIASQALITGSFSIVSEAIRLDLLPHMKTYYPSESKGQIFIPLVNNLIWAGCSIVVLLFRTSANMEAAYGLAITITLLMVTILLTVYLAKIKKWRFIAVVFFVVFAFIEAVFFVSCLGKFLNGGYVAIIIATLILLVMISWERGTKVERKQSEKLKVADYITKLKALKNDTSIPTAADNLVFLTHLNSKEYIDRDILYSILDKQPKRAKAYWFVNIIVTSKPFGGNYSVDNFNTNFIFKVTIRLGYKEEQRLNVYMKQIFCDLLKSGELSPQIAAHTIYSEEQKKKLKKIGPVNIGSVKYCLIRKQLIPESDLSKLDKTAVSWKYKIRARAGTPERWFGLETSSVIIEYVPLFIAQKPADKQLIRK